MKNFRIYELVKVIYVHAFSQIKNETEEPSFRFRIEVLRNTESNQMFAKVFRLENFVLEPMFGDFLNKSDEVVIVEDEARDWNAVTADKADQVIEKVIKILQNQLFLS